MLKQDKFWEKLSKETKPVGHMAPQKNESDHLIVLPLIKFCFKNKKSETRHGEHLLNGSEPRKLSKCCRCGDDFQFCYVVLYSNDLFAQILHKKICESLAKLKYQLHHDVDKEHLLQKLQYTMFLT